MATAPIFVRVLLADFTGVNEKSLSPTKRRQALWVAEPKQLLFETDLQAEESARGNVQ